MGCKYINNTNLCNMQLTRHGSARKFRNGGLLMSRDILNLDALYSKPKDENLDSRLLCAIKNYDVLLSI